MKKINRYLTKEQEYELKCPEQGKKIMDVAKSLGVSKQYAYSKRVKRDRPCQCQTWLSEEEDRILRSIKKDRNMTTREIILRGMECLTNANLV